jgi:hypothetical protein
MSSNKKTLIDGDFQVGSAHFYVDVINNRVGLNQANPTSSLDVNGNAFIGTDMTVASNVTVGSNVIAQKFTGSAAGLTSVPADQISGVIPVENGGTGTTATTGTGSLVKSDNPTFTGTVTADTFSGSGASLTNIPMGQATGTLAVANGGTGVTTSTGTGNTVLSASPTLTGAVTAETANFSSNVSASNIYAGYDTDMTSYLGRAAVGFSGISDEATFAHVDVNSTNNYALKQTATGETEVNSATSKSVIFSINDSEQGRINTTGLGVGTNNPQFKLDVHGTANVGALTCTTISGDGYLLSNVSGYSWPTHLNGNDIYYTTGNVGIGTATPGNTLEVAGTASVAILKSAADAATSTYNSILNGPRPGTTSGGAIHFINGSTRTSDGGASTYTIRNDSGALRLGNVSYNTLIDGNVGIGTTTMTEKLTVNGNIDFTPVYGNQGDSNKSGMIIFNKPVGESIDTSTNIDAIYYDDATNTYHFTQDTTKYATGNANIQCGAVTATTFSGALSNNLSPGSYLVGNAYNGSTARTFAVDATTTSTASKVVARDASKNVFVNNLYVGDSTTLGITKYTGEYGSVSTLGAGTSSYAGYAIRGDWVFMSNGSSLAGIYDDTNNKWATKYNALGSVQLHHAGNLKLETTSTGVTVTGSFSGALSGNASTATKLATARTIGGVSFDGSANITPTTFAGATFSDDVAFDTNTLFVDVSANCVGIGTTAPASPLHVSASTTSTHTMKISHSDTNATSGTHALLIDADYSGADTFTGDHTNAGIYIDLDSSATGGDTTNEHRIYGVYSDVRHSGDSNFCYSGYFLAQSDHTSGQCSALRGILAYAVDSANGTNSNVTAGEFIALKDAGSTNTTATMMGVRAEVEIDAGIVTNAYAVHGHIDRDGGTITTGYLFHGSYAGSDTGVKWGLYLSGDEINHVDGSFGIGTTAPGYKLEVSGTSRFDGEMQWGLGHVSHAGYSTNKDWYIRSGSSSGKVIIQDTGGNVGIGTSAPGHRLEVNGTARADLFITDNEYKTQDAGVVKHGGILGMNQTTFRRVIPQRWSGIIVWTPVANDHAAYVVRVAANSNAGPASYDWRRQTDYYSTTRYIEVRNNGGWLEFYKAGTTTTDYYHVTMYGAFI